MSLRETLEAAKQEAQEGGSLFFGKGKGEEEGEEASPAATTTGFSRRSTAKAKPTRERAASVRVVTVEDAKAGRSGKKPSEMTKEERKAESEARRSADDLRHSAATVLLAHDEEYQLTQRIWWIALGAGFVCTLISFGINYLMNKNEAYATMTYASIAMVTLVLAYVFILGSFVYDFIKGRPIRKRVDEEVKSMSKKKLEQLVTEDAKEKAAKKAGK